MAKLSKRQKLIREKVDSAKQYGIEEAIELLKELSKDLTSASPDEIAKALS